MSVKVAPVTSATATVLEFSDVASSMDGSSRRHKNLNFVDFVIVVPS
jgi:hypothetical protein